MKQWKIGIVGLGKMGGAIADSLLNRGHTLTVYDVNPIAVQEYAEKGATPANDIKNLGKHSEVIITSLPNTEIVDSVFKELLIESKTQTIFLEMSTVDPNFTRNLNEQVEKREGILIDLPISGSPDEARSGDLILMAGGPKETIQSLEPLLDCFAQKIHFVGAAGDAKAVKIVNNLMTLGNVAVAAEAFSVGLKFGIEPKRLFEVLNQSGGRSHHFGKRFPYALNRDFDGRFSVELGEKDLGIGLDLSKNVDVPTPIASLIQQLYRVAKKEGYGKEDIVSILKVYERWGEIDEEIY